MKNLLLLLVITSFIVSCSDNPPTQIDSKVENVIIEGLDLTFYKPDIKDGLTSIFFVNENIGYIGGYDGAMYKTTNGGNSWITLKTNTLLPLFDIYFLNVNEGFAVGGQDACSGTGCIPEGAIIIHTSDGGQNWNRVPLSLSQKIELNSVYFANNSTGFAVGGKSFLSTKDKGVTWHETKLEYTGGQMLDVKFSDVNNGLITGVWGMILKTTNGGIDWNSSNPFLQSGGHTFGLVDKNVIYIAGSTQIAKSTDFGSSWMNLPNAPTNIHKLVFTSKTTGYAFGLGQYSGGDFGNYYGSIYYTADGGTTWKGSNMITDVRGIYEASFPNPNVGFALSGSVVIKIKPH
ncbi:MAG: hypothetical protein HYZ54_02825 [Ignavibacteriae bacterium]|nr:hypothetical protein [Ignavibacteriota bacterium]